ncbi:hypothetical protein PR048_013013 [Dryococelus australis]|uniref:HTH psq-type domain-containing protein n=1 Tax=Dryococelus australis TaxID=614101 RepID=A0ABQ9HR02_9NEOP|nr:hypothetical protein PR048_013013 [Dryococelus australis]
MHATERFDELECVQNGQYKFSPPPHARIPKRMCKMAVNPSATGYKPVNTLPPPPPSRKCLERTRHSQVRLARNTWSEDGMKLAVNSMQSDNLSVREAANTFSVPKSTLQDQVINIKNGGEVQIAPNLGRFERTFLDSYDEHLVAHIKRLDDMIMPLTRK